MTGSLVLHQKFKTWAEVLEAIEKYAKEQNVPYTIFNCRKAETHNKEVEPEKQMPLEQVYKEMVVACKHYGKPRQSTHKPGTKMRVNQRTFKKYCTAKVNFNYSLVHNCHIVTKLEETHSNHMTDEKLRKHYPEFRRASKATVDKVNVLLENEAKTHRIRDVLLNSGVLATGQDVQNHRNRWLASCRGKKLSAEDSLFNQLQKLKDEDANSVVAIHYNQQSNVMQSIFFQTSYMRESLDLYPELLIMDTTYKICDNEMPLVVFSVVDCFGKGRIGGYAIIFAENKQIVTAALEVLILGCEKLAEETRVVYVDKAQSEIASIKQVLPNASVHLCDYHVKDNFKRSSVKNLIKNKDLWEIIETHVIAMIHSHTKEQYDDSYATLMKAAEGESDFMNYFNKNWHNSDLVWCDYQRNECFTLGERTTGRVESHNAKVKIMVDKKFPVAEVVLRLCILNRNASIENSQRIFNEMATKKYHKYSPDPVIQQILTINTPYVGKFLQAQYERSLEPPSDSIHEVTLETCDCKYFTQSRLICSHIFRKRRLSGVEIYNHKLVPKRWTVIFPSEDAQNDFRKFEILTSPIKSSKIKKNLTQEERYNLADSIGKRISSYVANFGGEEFHHRINALKDFEDLVRTGRRVAVVGIDGEGQPDNQKTIPGGESILEKSIDESDPSQVEVDLTQSACSDLGKKIVVSGMQGNKEYSTLTSSMKGKLKLPVKCPVPGRPKGKRVMKQKSQAKNKLEENADDPETEEKCQACDGPVTKRTSCSKDNQGRKYITCQNKKLPACKDFHKWLSCKDPGGLSSNSQILDGIDLPTIPLDTVAPFIDMTVPVDVIEVTDNTPSLTNLDTIKSTEMLISKTVNSDPKSDDEKSIDWDKDEDSGNDTVNDMFNEEDDKHNENSMSDYSDTDSMFVDSLSNGHNEPKKLFSHSDIMATIFEEDDGEGEPKCIMCTDLNFPTGAHVCIKCGKAVHIVEPCSFSLGLEEGFGEKRICYACSKKQGAARNNVSSSQNSDINPSQAISDSDTPNSSPVTSPARMSETISENAHSVSPVTSPARMSPPLRKPICFGCNEPAVLLTAKTLKNFGRRFYTCKTQKLPKCKWMNWLDKATLKKGSLNQEEIPSFFQTSLLNDGLDNILSRAAENIDPSTVKRIGKTLTSKTDKRKNHSVTTVSNTCSCREAACRKCLSLSSDNNTDFLLTEPPVSVNDDAASAKQLNHPNVTVRRKRVFSVDAPDVDVKPKLRKTVDHVEVPVITLSSDSDSDDDNAERSAFAGQLCNVCHLPGLETHECVACKKFVHSLDCSMRPPNSTNEDSGRLCLSCYCVLCKNVLEENHNCTCHICNLPIDIEVDLICYRCEKITHSSSVTDCSKQIRAPEKENQLRSICNNCIYAKTVNISASAKEEITTKRMLSDEHMMRASVMLSLQFGDRVGGLCSPMVVSNGVKVANPEFYPSRPDCKVPWVQIMNTGSLHWVTAIFLSNTNVKIIDSLRSLPITGHVKIQVAMMAFTKERITLTRPPCKQQTNGVDCGLFAIANATEFCFTSSIQYVDFDETQLRSHWLQCVESGKLTPFPRLCKRPKKVKELEDVEVLSTYCKCRLPPNYDDLIVCDDCGTWFHQTCVGLKGEQLENDWYCEACRLTKK